MMPCSELTKAKLGSHRLLSALACIANIPWGWFRLLLWTARGFFNTRCLLNQIPLFIHLQTNLHQCCNAKWTALQNHPSTMNLYNYVKPDACQHSLWPCDLSFSSRLELCLHRDVHSKALQSDITRRTLWPACCQCTRSVGQYPAAVTEGVI